MQPELTPDADCLQQIIETLTRDRLSKYLQATAQDVQQALHLYVLNTQASAAVLIDLHYIEIALRNKFDRELTNQFGEEWFKNEELLNLLTKRSRGILQKVRKDLAQRQVSDSPIKAGKVVAELTFGFWLQLTDSGLEHKLWTPCLYKAFLPRKAPKRSVFNQQLEKLRQLRNRVAHHEPIFHLDLIDIDRQMLTVAQQLCPATADWMYQGSSLKHWAKELAIYR